jgi:hypothetical protein
MTVSEMVSSSGFESPVGLPWISEAEPNMFLLQVTIGSPDLKANHMIEQIVDIVSEHEKYNK